MGITRRSRRSLRAASGLAIAGAAFALDAPAASPLAAIEAYRVREQTSAAIAFAGPARLAVTEYYLVNQEWPVDESVLELPASERASPDRGVASVRVDHGTILVTLGGNAASALHGLTIAQSPCLYDAYRPALACGHGFCPDGSRAVVGAPPSYTRTTFSNEQLPASCRGNGAEALRLKDSARTGDPAAQTMWAGLLFVGQLAPLDRAEAVRLLRAAAAQAHPQALALLGDAYATGVDGVLEPDLVEAHYWSSRAEAAGFTAVRANLAALEPRMTAAQLAEARARFAAEVGAAR